MFPKSIASLSFTFLCYVWSWRVLCGSWEELIGDSRSRQSTCCSSIPIHLLFVSQSGSTYVQGAHWLMGLEWRGQNLWWHFRSFTHMMAMLLGYWNTSFLTRKCNINSGEQFTRRSQGEDHSRERSLRDLNPNLSVD